jgi:hypothetical protein
MTEDVMKHKSQDTDLLTVIGMIASIAGILLCLFLLFTPVTFAAMGANVMIDRSPDLQTSMRWIQPILGQAIVEDALIRQRANDEADPALVLDGTSKAAPGSVQWILGRVIVELSQSRMASGWPDGGGQRNDQRIVRIARHAAEQLHGEMTGERHTGRVATNVYLMF